MADCVETKDTADHNAVLEHVEVVVASLARGARRGGSFED
jgi:hypothetical protein